MVRSILIFIQQVLIKNIDKGIKSANHHTPVGNHCMGALSARTIHNPGKNMGWRFNKIRAAHFGCAQSCIKKSSEYIKWW